MITYLTIMVTVLVLTQIIRIIQNAINLRRQTELLKNPQNQQLVRLWDKMGEACDKYLEEGEYAKEEENGFKLTCCECGEYGIYEAYNAVDADEETDYNGPSLKEAGLSDDGSEITYLLFKCTNCGHTMMHTKEGE